MAMNSSPGRIVREINRAAGHPAQGVMLGPQRGRNRFSHLFKRPSHKFLKGFALRKLPTPRFVFTVLRAPPWRVDCRPARPPQSYIESALSAKPAAVLLLAKTSIAEGAPGHFAVVKVQPSIRKNLIVFVAFPR